MGSALWQDERGSNSHKKEADDLYEHVTGGVKARKAVPVPVGNVRRDGRQDSGNEHKTHPTGKAHNVRLHQKEHDQDGFDQLGAKFDPEPFAKHERPGRARDT